MRFTIRDLLWLTMVAAMAVAWWVDRRGLIDSAARLKMDLQMSRSMDGLYKSGR
jgi:hypothetical protein